jgi:hypothetical protein
VIYTRDMAIRIALFTIPFAVVAGLVLLLNGVDASAGIAVAAFGLVAVAIGATLGYYADRLPELRRNRQPHHLAGVHHGD